MRRITLLTKTLIIATLIIFTQLFLVGCQPITTAPAAEQQPTEPITLVLASHDSFAASEGILTQFEEEHNVKLQLLQLGDAGEALNRIILSKDAPLADLFFGVDNTFLSRALQADIFVPYASPLLEKVPDDLKLDLENRLLPVDYGFVNLNADQTWFDEQGLALPQTLEELAEPEYRGLLVVQNPATSSPGLAFLLATIAHFGEDGYQAYWQALLENDALVTSGWSEAYFEHFTVGSGDAGNRPLVVSYSTSPPADVVYASDGRTEPASVNVSPEGATFRQIEFVGILQGTQHEALAQELIDFLLSTAFQEDIPLQMFVYPANADAALPEVFTEFADVVATPAIIDAAAIEENRESWIMAWTNIMLR